MDALEPIKQKIYEIRGRRVMLDKDLADLYQVTTGNLNKAVKRNIKRFPPDFMFQLTNAEFEELKANLKSLRVLRVLKHPYVYLRGGFRNI